ncbi:hypothetical protein GQ457_02G040810 [Hibiscus cannabinus]
MSDDMLLHFSSNSSNQSDQSLPTKIAKLEARLVGKASSATASQQPPQTQQQQQQPASSSSDSDDEKWQAKFGKGKDLMKGIYLGHLVRLMSAFFTDTEVEAARAYDVAALRTKGADAVTNFDMNEYDLFTIFNQSYQLAKELPGCQRSAKASDNGPAMVENTFLGNAENIKNGVNIFEDGDMDFLSRFFKLLNELGPMRS